VKYIYILRIIIVMEKYGILDRTANVAGVVGHWVSARVLFCSNANRRQGV
jgi:hypothetical protein